MSELILKKFTQEDVLLCLTLLQQKNPKVAMEIFKNGRTSLLYLPDSLNPDKIDWLKRKRNSVMYFGMSTKALNEKQQGNESVLVSKYALDPAQFTIEMGAVPIKVEGVGLIGCLALTGLAAMEDHRLAMELLEEINRRHDGA